ncbi:hypothetical protein L804_06642 [Cryptococcus deuterogattii 2001/935-1]|nr:hypothetical protein L804_06642 [Cryptococcus deuterogattii 2001/935-1]
MTASDLQACASEAEDKRLSLLMHPDTPSSRFRVAIDTTRFFVTQGQLQSLAPAHIRCRNRSMTPRFTITPPGT